MKEILKDIKDTEIRIVGDDKSFDSTSLSNVPATKDFVMLEIGDPVDKPPIKSKTRAYITKDRPTSVGCWRSGLIILIIISGIICLVVYLFRSPSEGTNNIRILEKVENSTANIVSGPEEIENLFETNSTSEPEAYVDILVAEDTITSAPHCIVKESSVNGIPFKIYSPQNAVASLHVGDIDRKDPNIILALQAADIRKDNGQIVGACVKDGEVISRGVAKQGFVAMINGIIKIGVSEVTPLFEEATLAGGDFFRQYPIVEDGRLVENNPKGLSVRRAVCEKDNQIFVTETLVPVSFHDFSQMMVDFGVRNAVYLVGSQYACGLYRDKEQQLTQWGEPKFSRVKNVTYLVWQSK